MPMLISDLKYLLWMPLICIALVTTAREKTPDVVIQTLSDTYKFVPDKTGNALDRIEHTSKTTFQARRDAAKAGVYVYYDDDISIDRTSADTKSFGSYFSDDVFFSDSKACILGTEIKKNGGTRDVSFKRTFHKPEFFCNVLLCEPYDVEQGEITFEIPALLADRYRLVEHDMPDSVFVKSTERKGDVVFVRYTYRNLKSPEHYDDSPSLNVSAPRLNILGHFKDADELYRYFRSFLPESDPGSAEVAAKALEVTGSCTDDASRMKAVADFVHSNIRYVAVENGELGHRPDLASEVLRKAYGDCKGSALLIKDMLTSLGMDARLVWIGGDMIDTRWSDVPNISSGNHMIAAVVKGDSITYIDGTATYADPGCIPISLQGAQAMIENGPENCILRDVPRDDPSVNCQSETWYVAVDVESGVLRYRGCIRKSGALRRMFMLEVDETPPVKRENLYSLSLSRAVKGSHAENVEIVDSGDELSLCGTLELAGEVKRMGAGLLIGVDPMSAFVGLRIDPEERDRGAVIPGPVKYITEISLEIPDGMSVDKLPSGVSIATRWLEGSLSDEVTDGGKTLRRRFEIIVHGGRVSSPEIGDFNAQVRKLSRACSAKIVLKSN